MKFLNEKIRRIVMAFSGVILTGFCVGGLQKANLGADPFTCFVTGIANVFSSTYSVFYVIITGLLFVGVFWADKKYLGIATIFNLVLTGVAARFSYEVLSLWMPHLDMFFRLGLMLFSLIIMCFSASLYFTADLGVSAYDAVSLILAKNWSVISFRYWRIATDSICVLIGFIFAVTLGIGTIITALFMGPIIQWFTQHVAEPLRFEGRVFKVDYFNKDLL